MKIVTTETAAIGPIFGPSSPAGLKCPKAFDILQIKNITRYITRYSKPTSCICIQQCGLFCQHPFASCIIERIERIHTKEFENGKNTFFLNVLSSDVSFNVLPPH